MTTAPHIISVRNVNHALHEATWWLRSAGERANSRNGPVVRAPGPVITVYQRPQERVLFNKHRDANPFFHLMEALWMLAGRNDVDFPAYYVQRMRDYSDNGLLLHGAYGFRWRRAFMDSDELEPIDQLSYLADHLRAQPDSRRAVLAMWSPELDIPVIEQTRDLPCNTHVYFQVHGGALDMTVLCRSNDMVWGAYGANAVHFSVLLEYMAAQIGCAVGSYTQFSNDFHLYTDTYPLKHRMFFEQEEDWRYEQEQVKPFPLVQDAKTWDEDLYRFMDGHATRLEQPFFTRVAQPMKDAHHAHKEGNRALALELAHAIAATDWRLACIEWLRRRGDGQ